MFGILLFTIYIKYSGDSLKVNPHCWPVNFLYLWDRIRGDDYTGCGWIREWGKKREVDREIRFNQNKRGLGSPIPVTILLLRLLLYLRTDAQHLQRRWHHHALGDPHVAKVHRERLAPNTKVANVKYGQVAGQRQNDRLLVVTTQRILFAIFIGYPSTLRSRLLTPSYPELGVYGRAVTKWNVSL